MDEFTTRGTAPTIRGCHWVQELQPTSNRPEPLGFPHSADWYQPWGPPFSFPASWNLHVWKDLGSGNGTPSSPGDAGSRNHTMDLRHRAEQHRSGGALLCWRCTYRNISAPGMGHYRPRVALTPRTPGWGFRTVRGGIDRGNQLFRPRFSKLYTWYIEGFMIWGWDPIFSGWCWF